MVEGRLNDLPRMMKNEMFIEDQLAIEIMPDAKHIRIIVVSLIVLILVFGPRLNEANGSSSTLVELSTSNGSTVCPASPLFGTWDGTTNTCSIQSYSLVPSGTTLLIDSSVTVFVPASDNPGVEDQGGIINLGTLFGPFTVDYMATFENNGSVTSSSGDRCTDMNGLFTNYGTITSYSTVCAGFFIAGDFLNFGQVNLFGDSAYACRTICPLIDNEKTGLITIETTGNLAPTGTTGVYETNNYGTIIIDNGGGVSIGGDGTDQTFSDTFNNYGTVIDNGGIGAAPTGTINNYGSIAVQTSGGLDNSGGVYNNYGVLQNSNTLFNNQGEFNNQGFMINSKLGQIHNSANFNNYKVVLNFGYFHNFFFPPMPTSFNNQGRFINFCSPPFYATFGSDSGVTQTGNPVINACGS